MPKRKDYNEAEIKIELNKIRKQEKEIITKLQKAESGSIKNRSNYKEMRIMTYNRKLMILRDKRNYWLGLMWCYNPNYKY